jgi:hypothetical protein
MVNEGNSNLRARARITSHFRIPSLDHLWPRLNRKILEIVLLFLRFCSIGATKYDPNPGANSVNLFLREPLGIVNEVPVRFSFGFCCDGGFVSGFSLDEGLAHHLK